MRSLDKFLDSLALHPLIKNSHILQDFLQMPENDYNIKKKEYSKLKILTRVQDMKSLEGEVLII